jgi:hypothetical protein
MSCGRTISVGRSASRGDKTDIDLIRYLSELAKQTRRPGQTLQARLNELRREHEFVAPSDLSAPHCAGGAAFSA